MDENRIMLPIHRIDNTSSTSDCNATSSIQKFESTANKIIIDIPPELLQNGKTLLVEEHSELFIGGQHLCQPPHPIRKSHGLCLIDTQQQDQRSVTATHQLQDLTEDSEKVQIKVEVPSEILQNGKTISILKSSIVTTSNQQAQPLGNFADLYSGQHSTESIGTNNIHIEIPDQLLERGQTILIHKENISVIKTDDYHEQQTHHLASNQFTKRDHLYSNNMMEVTFLVSPERLNKGQTITIRRENLQSTADYHHHQANSDTNQHQLTNDENSQNGAIWSMEEFMLNKVWNPSMSDDGQVLQMRQDFDNQPTIVSGDQFKLTLNGYDFRVETTDQQSSIGYRQITLPKTAQLVELKCEFDEQRRCLNISVPFH